MGAFPSGLPLPVVSAIFESVPAQLGELLGCQSLGDQSGIESGVDDHLCDGIAQCLTFQADDGGAIAIHWHPNRNAIRLTFQPNAANDKTQLVSAHFHFRDCEKARGGFHRVKFQQASGYQHTPTIRSVDDPEVRLSDFSDVCDRETSAGTDVHPGLEAEEHIPCLTGKEPLFALGTVCDEVAGLTHAVSILGPVAEAQEDTVWIVCAVISAGNASHAVTKLVFEHTVHPEICSIPTW